MRNLEKVFSNRCFDYEKLIKYGFKRKENNYIYKYKIYKEQFEMIVEISEKSKISKLIDFVNGDEYILVDIEESSGEFVGKVKKEYEEKLQDIIDNCTMLSVFREKQSQEIINYIKEKYNDELEFLWEKFDDNAIWRNKNNNKWYGLLMKIPKNKLGIDSEQVVEIIDLRYKKGETDEIIDNTIIFPGYHMNKDSWITIVLDGSLKSEEIFRLIDNSYILSEVGRKIND